MIAISFTPEYYWLPQLCAIAYCGIEKYQSVRPDETTKLN